MNNIEQETFKEFQSCPLWVPKDTNASDGSAMTDVGGSTYTIIDHVTQQTYDEQRAATDVVPAPTVNIDAGQETSSHEVCTNGQEVTSDTDTIQVSLEQEVTEVAISKEVPLSGAQQLVANQGQEVSEMDGHEECVATTSVSDNYGVITNRHGMITRSKADLREKQKTKHKQNPLVLFFIVIGLSITLFFNTMDMKKISCTVIVAAASMSAVMAADSPALAPAPGSALTPGSAPTPDLALAPGPDSFATSTLPALGSLVAASLVSFFAYYL
ncbi:hypothetical protein V6N13_130012 [Hibiscus sabdariffa]|uniref:Uncharacterized protein n=1 Tax=Hibiscus sabdariffa TaxID=183260 RepID=A0ABR2SNE8_9ROSI